MDLTTKLRQFLPREKQGSRQVARKVNLDPLFEGREENTPFGACYVMENSFPLHKKMGFATLGSALQVEGANLQKLIPGQNPAFDLQKAVFLDTETTGLAGGTGTYAFLIGLGRFQEGSFVVKQLLMRDYNEELAQLYLLDEELAKNDTIISFNGKRFDLPLLQTRFAIARVGFTSLGKQRHLDLLQPARRLWRHKLASCSLNSLERNLLGIKRIGDIPGFEIPQRYFDFLQTGNAQLLQVIIEHNSIDITSMAALLYRIHLAAGQNPEHCPCPWEAEALAHAALERGDRPLALAFLKGALAGSSHQQQKARLLQKTALLHKRRGEYEKAAYLWQELLQTAPLELAAYEELAKYYEHKLKDLNKAQHITRRALALALQAQNPPVLAAWRHRLQRIERKLAQEKVS